ncbi:anti-sigma factor [Actinomycetospora sp. NBRC 106375]|uniref:anti-sigma factor family protein n=1 Tax=Actinomycetospora sp. NBRC 106375 TaxID=3032207 RepID=UPI0024A11AD1|nr:zf-HC2 domain-containing protein [Actinomycetospora sp. NBRC 106375]GLZ47775.1 anti-sigma factor [Actinomycetospora sp. NBRC 106375]
MSCRHRFDVGVYVLGALEPAEREAFESHLPGCADCARSLGEVAGLPGLLSRVPEGDRDAEPLADPPPDLLAGTLRRVRRRRRTAWVLAAAAVVVALLGGGLVGWAVLPATTGTAATPPVREMALPPVADSPSSGLADLTARPWGTEIALSCLYHGAERPPAPPDAPRTTYVLVVRGPDGSEQQVARWSPPPDQDVRVSAATDLPPDRVRGLEVRTADGATVMRS